MKKIFAAALLTLTFAACKKHPTDGIQLPANTWNIYGETYTNGGSQRFIISEPTIGFTAAGIWADEPYLIAKFLTPPASGTYKVVATPVAPDEISFYYTKGINSMVSSSTSAGETATVVVRNGKATIVAGKVHMQRGPSQADTTTLRLNLTES